MLDTSPRWFSAAVQPRRWAGVPGAERGRAALSGGVGGDRGRSRGDRGGGEGRGDPAGVALLVEPVCRGWSGGVGRSVASAAVVSASDGSGGRGSAGRAAGAASGLGCRPA